MKKRGQPSAVYYQSGSQTGMGMGTPETCAGVAKVSFNKDRKIDKNGRCRTSRQCAMLGSQLETGRPELPKGKGGATGVIPGPDNLDHKRTGFQRSLGIR